MIAYFPEIFPDELLYSRLARYFAKSGYLAYRYAAEDLYANKAVRPCTDFLNEFTPDALQKITQSMPMESIVEKHTMFPYYGRFLPKERRNQAFRALVSTQGNYSSLLAMPKLNSSTSRYLRYCPVCAHNDRQIYGETNWHRIHQMQGVGVCSLHRCQLAESGLIVSGKASPRLVTAQEIIPLSEKTVKCENDLELQLAEYITIVFQAGVDMQSDVPIGDFLHSRMSGTKYRSVRGEQRNISLFHADFVKYYKSLPNNRFTELWQIQKVLTNDRVNIFEICMMGMFLDVPAADLVNIKLPKKTQEQLFDEKIYCLHEQGLKYPAIAKQLNAPLNTVKAIGAKRYGTYHKPPKNALKCGTKPMDWEQIDKDTLPLVEGAVRQLHGNGISRPRRITVFAVEKILNLPNKRIDNLPVCKAEIQNRYESQAEYWAKETVWAANTVVGKGQPFNWKHIRELTNMKKKNLEACMPYLYKYADEKLAEQIQALL